jgi:hypothetical protein
MNNNSHSFGQKTIPSHVHVRGQRKRLRRPPYLTHIKSSPVRPSERHPDINYGFFDMDVHAEERPSGLDLSFAPRVQEDRSRATAQE